MTFAPTYDLMDGQISPQERLRGFLLKILQRRKNISPNPADGFLTVGGKADSDAEGDGVGTSVATPGTTQGQN